MTPRWIGEVGVAFLDDDRSAAGGPGHGSVLRGANLLGTRRGTACPGDVSLMVFPMVSHVRAGVADRHHMVHGQIGWRFIR